MPKTIFYLCKENGMKKTHSVRDEENSKPLVKVYYQMFGVGKAKYVVNYHDGVKKHSDGSNFYDIAIFKNKVKLNKFISDLIKDGYREKYCMENL